MKEIPDLNAERSSASRRFLGWLFSPRTMRRALIGIAGLITFVAALYAVIDWRGKQRWENCKREMAAKGEAIDWAAYVPAPVPDDQNIFKAPKMAEWFGDKRGILDQPLERRLTNDFARRFFNTNSAIDISSTESAADYVAWSDQFQADFDAIRAALQRPYARLDADYSQPLNIPLPNAATAYAVVKTLTQRAKCHLLLGATDQAWRDLTLLRDLRRMVECQGKFITTEGDWMRREIARHCLQVVARGLELHAWREPQLVALQEQLKNADFIALHVEALKCGRALLLDSYANGDLVGALYAAGGDGFWARLKKHPEMLLIALAPRGVITGGAVDKVRPFRTMIESLSPADGILRPGEVSRACAWWKRAQDGLPLLLRTQTLVNEGQVACALERYHLAYGEYPDTLDALVPKFIETLPRDIINGKPLIYRRTNEGSFLLYSVGWNETDDGGQVMMAEAGRTKITEGDWVWKSYMY